MNKINDYIINYFSKEYTPESLSLEINETKDYESMVIFSLDKLDYEQMSFDLPVLTFSINRLKPSSKIDLYLGLMESYELNKEKKVYALIVKGF